MSAVGAWLIVACSRADNASREGSGGLPAATAGSQQFTRVPASYSGVTFENQLTPTRDFNVFTYRNFYNGGGVAAGDLTGDGLPELVMTANQGGPRLYLNLGAFHFRDVSSASGMRFKGRGAWITGVTMADVNGDGRLDVYLCYAGAGTPEQRANELWLNDGVSADSVPHFHEAAAQYGIADQGYTTQAVFFDYDRDGQLDLFLINNSPRPVTAIAASKTDRSVRDRFGGHKLYHNVGGHFTDVTASAGIYEAEMGLGLGAVASDLNGDGWPDLYVANDFFEKDYLYVNNGNGTFTEKIDSAMPVISAASMGMDVADVNNDGLPDVYTTDMLPADELRLKRTTAFETWESYQQHVRNGFHHQFTRNMLQLNNGNGTFSDIGQMAGVARTDWSWGALIADFDLDGNKDIFVSNGIAKDVTLQDYLEYLATQRTGQLVASGQRVDFLRLIEATTSTKLSSFLFHSNGDLTFTNVSSAWGLGTPGFSSGAAYVDLDGDGALDLVVNRVDDTALVYRNNARVVSRNHYLQLVLDGDGPNRFAVGARATVFAGTRPEMQELLPTRGFQSSMDYVLTFGVGARDSVDSVRVDWPDGRVSTLRAVATNTRVRVSQATSAKSARAASRPSVTLLHDVTDSVRLPFVHHENAFSDFDREPLMPKLMSTEGPTIAVADVNGDGLDDMYIGGARGQSGSLMIQQRDGRFTPSSTAEFAKDSASEDVGAVFFDANGDDRPDLYVVSGGNEYSEGALPLQDRLYLNVGGGAFRKSDSSLPRETNSGSRVAAADYDRDGDVDLFVGGRVVPWRYGMSATSMLLQNDGRGHFTDVTDQMAPGLRKVGMVTDAAWRDVDGDGRLDLIVVGDWLPITIFHNTGGGHLAKQEVRGLEHSSGWWNHVIAGDFTGNGRVDLIVGNAGLNSRLQASATQPVTMYAGDLAHDGYVQQVLCAYNNGVSYPIAVRDALTNAIPSLQRRFLTYESYAHQTCADLFSPADLAGVEVRKADTFASMLARNNGDGSFTLVPLPSAAQVAPVYGLLGADVNHDGKPDLLLGGNFDGVQPEIGRMSASYGLLLLGDGKGGFQPMRVLDSGFFVPGQTRDVQRVRTARGDIYVVGRNNDRPLVFRAGRSGKP